MKRKTKVRLAKIEKFGYRALKKLVGIILGSALVAYSYNALVMPHGLLAGGIGGLSIAGHYIFGIPVYLSLFLLNVPIFLWGLKELDKEFIFYSLLGVLTVVIGLPLSRPYIMVPQMDIFLASVFSGIVSGLGVGIVLKMGASGGGVDIIAIIMKKKANLQVGMFSFALNLIVLAISLAFFRLDITLYTFISMYVTGKVMDFVLEGYNRKKSVTIISEKSSEIAGRIMKEIGRGVTYLEGYGGFTGDHKTVINSVVNNFENAKIREIVLEIDPRAFVFVTEAIEVNGKGFTFKNVRDAAR